MPKTVKRKRTQTGKPRAKRGYSVVAISLYTDQRRWVDRMVREVGAAGHKKNRSFVLQVAIETLAQQLLDTGRTTPDAVAGFFRSVRRNRAALGLRHQHLWLH
jgi:hypothetical protein